MIVWIQNNSAFIIALLFAMLTLSEALALIPSIQSNSIFQLVVKALKFVYNLVKPKEKPPV